MKTTISPFAFHTDKTTPLGHIAWSGTIVNSPGHAMRRVPNLNIVYVLDGSCHYSDDRGRSAQLVAGDLFLVLPGISQSYRPAPAARWTEHYIHCAGPVFDMWMEKGLLSPDRVLFHLEPIKYWHGRMLDVVGQAIDPTVDEMLTQVAKAQALLADVLRCHSQSARDRADQQWLARACAVLLDQHHGRSLSLRRVSKDMGTSYDTFRKRFATLAGTSPTQYRKRNLIHKACELIHRERLRNKELADRLGFCDEYHFSRQFRRIVGIGPREYARRMREACPSTRTSDTRTAPPAAHSTHGV